MHTADGTFVPGQRVVDLSDSTAVAEISKIIAAKQTGKEASFILDPMALDDDKPRQGRRDAGEMGQWILRDSSS
jgi:hypothetical protein